MAAPEDPPPAHPFTSIGVFNYKGGAAKTTLCVNLGAALAHPDACNKNVLLIDFDSQCNLTQHYKDYEGEEIADDDKAGLFAMARDGAAGEHDSKATYTCPKDMSVKQIGAKLGIPWRDIVDLNKDRFVLPKGLNSCTKFKAHTVLTVDASSPEQPLGLDFDLPHPDSTPLLIGSFVESGKKADKKGSPTISSLLEARLRSDAMFCEMIKAPGILYPCNEDFMHGNLQLLRGSFQMSALEDTAAEIVKCACSNAVQADKAATFQQIFRALADVFKLDIILVDMSPSSGFLNQWMAMSLDYILPPAFCDTYSTGSVYGLLTSVLPKWMSWRKKVIDFVTDEEITDTFHGRPPVLLPFVMTNYSYHKDTCVQPPLDKRPVSITESNFFLTLTQFVRDYEWPSELYDLSKKSPEPPVFAFQHTIPVLMLAPHTDHVIVASQESGRSVIEFAQDPKLLEKHFKWEFIRADLESMDYTPLVRLFARYGIAKPPRKVDEAGHKQRGKLTKAILVDTLMNSNIEETHNSAIAKQNQAQNEAVTMSERYTRFAEWLLRELDTLRKGTDGVQHKRKRSEPQELE